MDVKNGYDWTTDISHTHWVDESHTADNPICEQGMWELDNVQPVKPTIW
jgi:hypothetical protein